MAEVHRTMAVWVLDDKVKRKIQIKLEKALKKLGYKGDELDDYVRNGMDGRLCDLEDVISIKEFLK